MLGQMSDTWSRNLLISPARRNAIIQAHDTYEEITVQWHAWPDTKFYSHDYDPEAALADLLRFCREFKRHAVANQLKAATANSLRVGVVGYCPPTRFDAAEARKLVSQAFEAVISEHPNRGITVVSGLSDVGVLAIAYAEAAARGWRTAGITSMRCINENYPLFPVDEKMVVGADWGDESPTFLADIDMLVRIGGGPQSRTEAETARQVGITLLEYELPAL